MLFVHGRESYRKNSLLILYNFFKNVVYVCAQYFFGAATGFSGQVLYDQFIYQLYNMTMTSFPILWYAVFDFEYLKKPVGEPAHAAAAGDGTGAGYLLRNPALYKIGLDGACYSDGKLAGYLLYGL